MTIGTGNSYLDSLAPKSSTDPVVKPKGNGTLGQSDFLKLLTTQMTTQDPFDPVDNTQMVAQMAQFSSTTGIAEMNQSLKQLVAGMNASRVGDAASWIGKAALVPSETAAPLGDGSYAGVVNLPDFASRVDISLADASGKVVYTANANNVPKGDVPFYWDGKDQDGAAVAGPVKMVVTAKNLQAESITGISTASWTNITSVSSPASGATKLVTPLGRIDPADALELS